MTITAGAPHPRLLLFSHAAVFRTCTIVSRRRMSRAWDEVGDEGRTERPCAVTPRRGFCRASLMPAGVPPACPLVGFVQRIVEWWSCGGGVQVQYGRLAASPSWEASHSPSGCALVQPLHAAAAQKATPPHAKSSFWVVVSLVVAPGKRDRWLPRIACVLYVIVRTSS